MSIFDRGPAQVTPVRPAAQPLPTCSQPLPGPYPMYGCLLEEDHEGDHEVLALEAAQPVGDPFEVTEWRASYDVEPVVSPWVRNAQRRSADAPVLTGGLPPKSFR